MTIAGISVLALGAATNEAVAGEWEWTLAPYLWGSDISLDVRVNDEEVIGSDLEFSDLLDKLDFAAQVHFEGRRDKLGFFVDLTTLSTSDSLTTAARPPLPGGTLIETGTDMLLIETAGFYRPSGGSAGLDLLFGLRYTDLDVEIDVTLPDPPGGSPRIESAETLTDGFVGLRYSAPFARNWMLLLRGDVGAGDSDLALNASAYVGYQFGQRDQFSVLGGYRYLSIEYDSTANGSALELEQTMSGPALGFAFRF